MEKVRFGIIGYGYMGHRHARMLASLEDAELTAICDIDPEQLKTAPEGVRTYRDAAELLKEELNTVILSVPNPLHREMAEMAARAGINIICEKPAAMSVREFDEMREVAEKCGVKLAVHHQRRWDRDYRAMKEVYDRGMLGDVYLIKSQLYGAGGDIHGWRLYPQLGGGMLFDWGVHLIDQVLDMVDSEIDSVYADVKNVVNEKVDDYFNIIFKFKNRITAEIELGTYYLTPRRAWFLGGNCGSAMEDGFDGEGVIVHTRRLEAIPIPYLESASSVVRSMGMSEDQLLYEEPLPEVEASHRDYFVNYLNMLAGKEDMAVSLDEVRRGLCLIEAIRQSARTNEAVRFEA